MKPYQDKNYWLMCEKAVEIQESKKAIENGDIYYNPAFNGVLICSNYFEKKYIPNIIWLPTQSQLQEMVRDKYIGTHLLYANFNEWYWRVNKKTDISTEQLWLAFVMKEKYNKLWNGKDWIKI